MKRTLVFILLIAFVIKPIYNLGYLAYYEINVEYITEMFCVNKEKVELACNGKCHLSQQLQTDTNSQEDNKTLVLLNEYLFGLYFQEYENFKYKEVKISLNKKVNSLCNNSYAYLYEHNHFRPPMV
ncbi:hypothetical protein [Algibacter pectinivorans]|uniref:Uncharacterized protein n=1 Tax=Algibacter pectinivorans TaxID=870482 RepID=A0A1I1QC80_9FLAO|nr:hypothetical protein [Algibacter pectinivorans]SFD19754.1 hypothetical protein SAMN04487987_10625 [Algibacter pectinivorans]